MAMSGEVLVQIGMGMAHARACMAHCGGGCLKCGRKVQRVPGLAQRG